MNEILNYNCLFMQKLGNYVWYDSAHYYNRLVVIASLVSAQDREILISRTKSRGSAAYQK